MSIPPVISVVIPVYNRAEMVKRAIESVLLQKGVDWELIVVDDGSTDNTPEELDQYDKDDRIHLVRQNHSGVSAARNRGVQYSTGKYIAFLDSDDEWLPGKLEAQKQFFESSDYQIQQTTEIWIRNGTRVNPPRHLLKKAGHIFEESLERCMVTPSSVCLTRELFEGYGGFDVEYPACEDYELWLRITTNHPVGLIEKDYLKRYGGHEDQLSAEFGLDRYRIRALNGLLQKGTLSESKREHTLSVLGTKLDVYRKGCVKHGKPESVDWCDRIKKKAGLA
ncbi:MAG: glycosyltransferase family 2 protein [Fibrobacteria bacterium]|nr:glycosyltransferase family 2 protein [Fibrobacteria bacterium]